MRVCLQNDLGNLGFAEQAIERGQIQRLQFIPPFQKVGAVVFGGRKAFHLRRRRCGIGLPNLPVQSAGIAVQPAQGDFRRWGREESARGAHQGREFLLKRLDGGFGWRMGLRGHFFQLLANRVALQQRQRGLAQQRGQACLHRKFLFERCWRGLYARVHFHRQRGSEGFSIDRKPDGVVPRQNGRAEGVSRRVVRNRGARIVVAHRGRRRAMQAPDPAVHSGIGWKLPTFAHPIQRN